MNRTMFEYLHHIFFFLLCWCPHSFIHSFIHSFVHSFIRSFVHWYVLRVAASSILFIASKTTFPRFDSKHVHNGHPSPFPSLALYSWIYLWQSYFLRRFWLWWQPVTTRGPQTAPKCRGTRYILPWSHPYWPNLRGYYQGYDVGADAVRIGYIFAYA